MSSHTIKVRRRCLKGPFHTYARSCIQYVCSFYGLSFYSWNMFQHVFIRQNIRWYCVLCCCYVLDVSIMFTFEVNQTERRVLFYEHTYTKSKRIITIHRNWITGANTKEFLPTLFLSPFCRKHFLKKNYFLFYVIAFFYTQTHSRSS